MVQISLNLVSTVTVGAGGASSIEFTSIPQDGKDLLVVLSIRDSNATVNSGMDIAINNSTSGFTNRRLYGAGNGVGSDSGTTGLGNINGANSTASTFSSVQIYFPNYTGSTAKSFSMDSVMEANVTSPVFAQIYAGNTTATAAITSIKFTPYATAVQYTTASLYTIS